MKTSIVLLLGMSLGMDMTNCVPVEETGPCAGWAGYHYLKTNRVHARQIDLLFKDKLRFLYQGILSSHEIDQAISNPSVGMPHANLLICEEIVNGQMEGFYRMCNRDKPKRFTAQKECQSFFKAKFSLSLNEPGRLPLGAFADKFNRCPPQFQKEFPQLAGKSTLSPDEASQIYCCDRGELGYVTANGYKAVDL